jgi:hypothetical protein
MPPLRKKRKISTARKQLSLSQQQQQLKGVKLSPEEIQAHMRCGFCHQAGTRDILQAGNLYSLRTDKVSENASCSLGYSVADPARSDPEFFGLVRCGIIFLDPRQNTTILTGQFLERLIFFSR